MPNAIECEIGFETQLWPKAYKVVHKSLKNNKFGFYMPPRELVYLSNNLEYIHGYDPIPKTTDCISECDNTSQTILHNFINFILMCKNRNTNAIDSLYVDDNLIEKRSKISDLVIKNRDLFIGPTIYHAYYEQSIKLFNKLKEFREPSNSYNTNIPTRKRTKKIIRLKNYNFDPELAVHSIRLMNQAVQWCMDNGNDLSSEHLLNTDIINGEVNWEDLQSHYNILKQRVEVIRPDSIKVNSDINIDLIREFLKNCLEEYYGTMKSSNLSNQIIKDIDKVIRKYKV